MENGIHYKIAQLAPFYYGWVIVAICAIAGAFNVGLMIWGLGVFLSPMQEELGWNRSTFFLPLAVGGIAASILGPIIGRYSDQEHGPRLLFLAGVLLLGSSAMYMRNIESVPVYLLIFGLVGGVGRYCIQLITYIIPKWFVRRRGLAQGISLAGIVGAGPLIFPVLLQFLFTEIGWRDTWFAMGVALIVIGLPATFLIIRQPEDVGLKPDGDSLESLQLANTTSPIATPTIEVSITGDQAIRTRQFWILAVSTSLGMLAIQGIIPNFIPFFISQGISPAIAAGTVSAYALSAMTAGLFWGLAADRYGHHRAYIIACSLLGSLLLAMLLIRSPIHAFSFMVSLGLPLSGFWVLQFLLVANTFGRRHIGAIRGAMQPFNNAAMYGGPLLFGVIFDLRSDYAWLFSIAGLLFLTSAVIASFLRPLPTARP